MYELDDSGIQSLPTAGQVLLCCFGLALGLAWQGWLVYLIWTYLWLAAVPEFGHALPLGCMLAMVSLLSLTFNGLLKLISNIASRAMARRKPSGRQRVPGGTFWARLSLPVKFLVVLSGAIMVVGYVGFDFILWNRVVPLLLPGLFVTLSFWTLLAIALIRHGIWLADRGLTTLLGLLFPRDAVSSDQA